MLLADERHARGVDVEGVRAVAGWWLVELLGEDVDWTLTVVIHDNTRAIDRQHPLWGAVWIDGTGDVLGFEEVFVISVAGHRIPRLTKVWLVQGAFTEEAQCKVSIKERLMDTSITWAYWKINDAV